MSGQGSPTQWYVARDGQQHGPLSDAEMRLFVQGGHLKSSDLIWRPGFPDWKLATEVFPPKAEATPRTQTAPEKTAETPAVTSAQSGKAERSAGEKPAREQPAQPSGQKTAAAETPAGATAASAAPRPAAQNAPSPAQNAPSQAQAQAKATHTLDAKADTPQTRGEAEATPKQPAETAKSSHERSAGLSSIEAWPKQAADDAARRPAARDKVAAAPLSGSPAKSGADRDPFDPETWQQAEAHHSGGSAPSKGLAPAATAAAAFGARQGAAPASPSPATVMPSRASGLDERPRGEQPDIEPQPRPRAPQRAAASGTGPARGAGTSPGPVMPDVVTAPVTRGDIPAAMRATAPHTHVRPSRATAPGASVGAYPPLSESGLPDPIGRAPEAREQAPRISVPSQAAQHNAFRADNRPDHRDEGRAGLGRIAAVVTGLVVLSGLGYTGYTHRETIAGVVANAAQMIMPDAKEADGGPPVIRVEPKAADRDGAFETAALDTTPPQGRANDVSGSGGNGDSGAAAPVDPADPVAALDREFSKSELWSLIKRDFPDWYDERLEEVARMSKDRTETDVSALLINRLVNLRRSNAQHALAASPDKLEDVAEAFLANLQSLTAYSTEACFRFISQGESSDTIVELIGQKPYGPVIERQIAAIFRAIADGKSGPNSRTRAEKADYDQLASELGKLGWDQADLKLFADPTALSKAPPELVCKMVQDWFQAHIAISDKSVQERLLFETLRPVVAG